MYKAREELFLPSSSESHFIYVEKKSEIYHKVSIDRIEMIRQTIYVKKKDWGTVVIHRHVE